MMKLYIRSLYSFVDQVSRNILQKTIFQLAEEYEQLEFWFVACRTDFDAIAIQIIMDLRKQHPDKQIDIVAITDPLRYSYTNVEEFPEEDYRFPFHSITKLQAAPLIQGKCEQYQDRYLTHLNKIEKWIIDQCDIILAFYYEDIPSPLAFEMQRLKKEKMVIPVFNPDIAKELLIQMDQLDERPRSILLNLKEGRTYTSIAKELNVSVSRVRQQAYTSIRSIFREVGKHYI
ncbi:MAG: hypothetical protein ACLRPE_12930 [Blautia producta]